MNRRSVGRRTVDRHGWEITWRQFEKTGEDEHNDAIYDNTDETIMAYVQFNSVNAPSIVRGPDGSEFTVDVQVFVKDIHDITPLGRGGRADRFIVDNKTYRVVEDQYQHNGLINCVSTRG
jgi:hypothetical protein